MGRSGPQRGVAERGGAGRGAVQRARNTRAASGVSESRGTSKARCPTRTSFLVGNSVSVSTVNTPKPPPPLPTPARMHARGRASISRLSNYLR